MATTPPTTAATVSDGGTSFDDAIPLTIGKQVSGQVAKGAKRFYKFDLTAGQAFVVTMQPGEGDLDLYGHGPGPTDAAIGISGKSNTEGEELAMKASDSGTYYVYVDGCTTSSYKIRLTTPGAVPTQPATTVAEAGGASFDDAIILTPGPKVAGSVVKDAKVHYKFHLRPGQVATVVMCPTEGDLDLSGYRVGNTSTAVDISGKSDLAMETVNIGANTEGWHYAVVDGFSTSDFEITLTISGSATDEPPATTSGSGASFNDAIALTPGLAVESSVAKGAKVHYKFHLKSGQVATVVMHPLEADLDLSGYRAGDTDTAVDISGKSDLAEEQVNISAKAEGWHYAVVDGFMTSKFTIKLAITGGS